VTDVGGAEHGESDAARRLPPWAIAWRGLGLAGLAAALALGTWGLSHRSPWLGLTAGPVLGLGALLAAWAAAIHLTGGEKFDDHPCV
jgi:hypothetical protein